MDILIETSTSKEVKRWGRNPGKVLIPGGNGDVVFTGTARPLDIGSEHFLATATLVEEPLINGTKRGPDIVTVDEQEVTITRSAVAKTSDDLMTDWLSEMLTSDQSLPRSVEDVIDVLVAKNVFDMVDLPKTLASYHAAKKTLRATKP